MLNIISKTSRSISFEIQNDECFFSGKNIAVFVDDVYKFSTDRNVFTVNCLHPAKAFVLSLQENGQEVYRMEHTTEPESFVLDVRRFGARGDGVTIDTPAIQAAIAACPPNGRIYFSKGVYLSTPIFLKSDITIELHKEATILGVREKELYPILPGVLKDYDEETETYLGSWEGNPLNMYASLITGINVSNVNIIGKGTLDGNAWYDTWWKDTKFPREVWRPRLIYLYECDSILVEGITVKNSPAWNVHPHRSNHLKFINLQISNPLDSPNTDGIDPEFCSDVLICGVRFSVGDDCIAIKAGKLFMGKKGFAPSNRFYIRNNLMEFGHGAVVIGSEIAGGVRDIFIEKCLFIDTDRGLRIKTRRGRGTASVVDNICMKNIKMDKVLTPFVINMFYFCDPDGKTEYVYSKEKLPVDHRTPTIGAIHVENVDCNDAQVAAAFMYGLPENKIKEVNMKNVHIKMAKDCTEGFAAMMDNIPQMSRHGLYFNNICKITLNGVKIEGVTTEHAIFENVDEVKEE